MKKILKGISVVVLLFASSSINAGTAGMSSIWEFNGVIGLNDTNGEIINQTAISGYFDFDSGSVDLVSDIPFYGMDWYLDGTVTDLGDGTYLGDLSTSWSINTFTSDMLWDITDNGDYSATLFTLDGDNDGITGMMLLDGPWVGWSPYLEGTLTSVPVPAALWLFVSGFIALAGMTRRKY